MLFDVDKEIDERRYLLLMFAPQASVARMSKATCGASLNPRSLRLCGLRLLPMSRCSAKSFMTITVRTRKTNVSEGKSISVVS
jgi:hypothetical protein